MVSPVSGAIFDAPFSSSLNSYFPYSSINGRFPHCLDYLSH